MSSNLKWALGAVAVVLIGGVAWNSGVFGGSATEQTATVANTVIPTGNTDTASAAASLDVASLDAAIKAFNDGITAAGTAPTKAQLASLSDSAKAISAQMNTLGLKLQTQGINAHISKDATTKLQAALRDMSAQLSNMGSQVSTAAKNSMSTSTAAMNMSKDTVKQLQKAAEYLKAARADIDSVVAIITAK